MPLLLNYSIDVRTAKTVDKTLPKQLHVDLSRVEEVDVLGAVIFATNLAKMIVGKCDFPFWISPPVQSEVAKIFREINYSRLLSHLGMREVNRNDLLSLPEQEIELQEVWSNLLSNGREALIFVPSVEPRLREPTLDKILDSLQNFYSSNPSEIINFGQIHQILLEIIKNTIDHSGQPGVLGLKFESHLDGHDKLSFVHCEIGSGISLNVRGYLSDSENPESIRLSKSGSTADFIHWAFEPGHSSKLHSGVNAGLGLSTIRAAARGQWARVYLFDANSILYVTDIPDKSLHSHRTIRQRMNHSHRFPCFMFFGHTI